MLLNIRNTTSRQFQHLLSSSSHNNHHPYRILPIMCPSSYTRKYTIPSWATYDPEDLGVMKTPHHVQNIVQGKWTTSCTKMSIPNPMDKNSPPLFTLSDTSVEELGPFVSSMKSVSKSGVHNPLKNVDRYLMYGEIFIVVKYLTIM